MLNLMLVQTGKFFRDAASREPKDHVAARNLLKQVGESANNRFHEALDEIEMEITRAKAVFERDIRKARAKRAEREKAAGILTRPAGIVKNRSPSAETKKSPATTGAKSSVEGAKSSEAVTDVHVQTGDQMMVNGNEATDATQLGKLEPPGTGLGGPTQNNLKVDGVPALHNDLTQTEKPTITSASKTQDRKPEESAPQSRSPNKPQPDGIPTSANEEKPLFEEPSTNAEAAPFESMFDLDQPDNGNGLDFDLDLSNGQDLLNDSLFEDLGAPSNNENTDLNASATGAEDINTLLPGLENYVNDNGDFSMIDLPVGTVAQDAAMPSGTTAAEADGKNAAAATDDMTATQVLEEMPMESNFDDLFGNGDWAGNGEMGDGAMVDFDDDWFKTDG
ncbi:MAG: hypothetical protein Q9191_007373 [Dirinaria sp. TL-2023a]